MNNSGYWRLVLLKQSPAVQHGIPCEQNEKVVVTTQFATTKEKALDTYIESGFRVVNDEFILGRMPDNYEGLHSRTKMFMPRSAWGDPPAADVQEDVLDITPGQSAEHQCTHKYNCRAHKDVCIAKFGIKKLGV